MGQAVGGFVDDERSGGGGFGGGGDGGKGRGGGKPPKRGSAKPAPKRRKRGGAGGFLISILYWGFVLCLWAGIAVIGVVVYYGAQLPSSDTWAVPDRPPNIRILAADGQLISNRGQTGGEAASLRELPEYVPAAFIAIEDRRFYDHFGVDLMGLAAVAVESAAGRPRHPRRLHHHPAAGQEPVPHPRPDPGPQGAGSAARRSGWNRIIPRTRSSSSISTASSSATMPPASRRRPRPISASRPAICRWAKPPCWPARCRPRRASIPRGNPAATAARQKLVLNAMAERGLYHPARKPPPPRSIPARPCAPRSRALNPMWPTGSKA